MAFKVKFRTLFPALVNVTSPILLTKAGSTYTFGFDANNAPVGPAGPTGAAGPAGPTGATGGSPTFVYVGDSLSDVSGVGTWPLNLASSFAFFNRGATYNYAVGGQTAATMSGLYASQPGAVVHGSEAYLFVWSGRNDVNASTAAATIYGYLSTEWASGRTSGYKVVAFTVMLGQDTAPNNAIRVELNRLIRSDRTKFDYLVETDLYFADAYDLTLRDATSHLSTAGNAMLAQRVAAVVLGVETVPAQPSDGYSINLALNSAMDVDQRNAGAAVTGLTGGSNSIIVDGYRVLVAGTSTVTAQQVADAPTGLVNSLKVTVTTAEAALAAGSYVWVRTAVEGYNTARLSGGTVYARPITIGFWTKINRIGSYSGSIVNGASTRTYPFTFTQNVANSWEFKTVIIPGDVAGAWGAATTGAGLYVFFVMAAGTAWTGTANAWSGTGSVFAVTGTTNGVAAVTDVFQISGVIILPAYHALLAERIPRMLRALPEELRRCRRYLMVHGNDGVLNSVIGSGYFFDATNFMVPFTYGEKMRAIPAMTISSAAHFQALGTAGFTPSALVLGANATPDQGQMIATVAAATAGQGGLLRNQSTSARLYLDASL